MKVTERDIVQGCIDGKRQSQQLLYDTYSRKMLGVCMRYSSTKPEAEDLLQEAFVKVFLNIKSFKFSGSFEGWIRRIVVHNAIRNYHKNKLEDESTQTINDATLSMSNDVDVLDKLSEKEIVETIMQLPVGYRTVFNLFFVEGYDHREIGQMLQINESTSRSQLTKAKKMLQQMITQLNKVTNEFGR